MKSSGAGRRFLPGAGRLAAGALLGLAAGCATAVEERRASEEFGGVEGLTRYAMDSVHEFAPGLDPARTGGRDPAAGGGGGADPQAPQADPRNAEPKRLMIYTASYELLVPSVADSIRAFVERVEGLGGYLQKRDGARVACRVPAARFGELIAAIPSIGAVLLESLEAADVTRAYRDLEIRIENAEKARQRLLSILEKADKVEEVLAIEADLRRLTEEIERMKGELRYLADQIAFSTITVLFRSSAPEPTPVRARQPSRFEWLNEVGVENVLSHR
jgi:hypothetical protein